MIIIVCDQVEDPKTEFSRSCIKSVHLPKSENFSKSNPGTTLQKGCAMNVLNMSPSRASKTPKSFLSNSIDNNLSRKVLFQTAATLCFPIFEHSCLFLREIFVYSYFQKPNLKRLYFGRGTKVNKMSCENYCTTWRPRNIKVLQ